jgi:tetratricopeptide (TPR) repeat protein
MTEQAEYPYDVFISYSHADRAWVWDELLPRLEGAGLKVIIDDRDFEPGAPLVSEKERAALQSRKTLLVLSPAYVDSEWAEFENILVQTLDPAARKRRLIPLVRAPCRISLRIRPLVSVDLTTGSDVQWQRLLNALDPNRPPAASPIQNLALAITDSTAPLPAPGWHPWGSTWLALGLLGVVLLVGLVNLLLYDWPPVRSTASVMASALVLVFGGLGLREDRDFFQRLSHFLGQARLAQAGLGAFLALALLLWVGIGWPKLQHVVAGPLGPKPPGVQRFAIGAWKNLTPGASPYQGIWTAGTRRILYEKLSRIDTLQGIAVDSPQVTDDVRRNLDLWIDGAFSKIVDVTLSASIAGQGGKHLGSVSVQKAVDEQSAEVESQILATQDELARELVAALGIQLLQEVADAMRRTPTSSAQALHLNNEAAVLMYEGELERAESLLREALTLDPDYAAAHNNLGRLLRVQGDLPGAIAEYEQATLLLPRYPIFHFNLGFAYDLAGDFPAAIRAYEQALALDPTFVRALNNLAFVYLETGELGKASELLQRGLRLDPDAAYLHKNLGRVHLEEGRAADAVEALTRAIQLSDVPYAEALYYLALAYRDTGQIDDACAVLSNYAEVAQADALDDPARPAAAKTLAAELQCP